MKVKVKMTPTQAQLLIVYKIGLATPTSYMNIDGFGGGVGILVSIASYMYTGSSLFSIILSGACPHLILCL